MSDLVIAVDPGREKCGIAVVDKQSGVLYKNIVNTSQLIEAVVSNSEQYQASLVILGSGTSSIKARERLQAANAKLDIVVVDEYRTTDAARIRYWQENPPSGFKRFLPVTMLVPPVPVDDYAAVIIAEKYLYKIRL
ncbi:pre-16S rRNA-processing nuclease YqgF [bacterium BFN5]|nr:pre-16S rRNA-processing nuclease YqgF [bacterium BFN5]QJW47017.1 pre-16S rRNA-processing nuclease YqgF [bacterium BFN5]